MSILVTGGTGYIGSHCVKRLLAGGEDVVAVDLVARSFQEDFPNTRLYVGDIRDSALMETIMQNEQIDAVMHFAAWSLVGESVQNPGKYFRNNVDGAASLLDSMVAHGVQYIVFSSTAATYGEPRNTPIVETDPQVPTNPYGASKRMVEEMLQWYAEIYGISYCALRYFNVAGAWPDGSIGEAHAPETHIIPLVLQAAKGEREYVTIYGDDYPTPDGTCIRDYIHVCDLIESHVQALDFMRRGGGCAAFNLGIGRGFSVKEVIEAAKAVTGVNIPVRVGARRAGDPSVLVASGEKARELLGFAPKHLSPESIIADAWRWHNK